MIIASAEPPDVKPERFLSRNFQDLQIDIDNEDAPYDDAIWIATKHAVPHKDPDFEGLLFLTWSFKSNWFLGDARCKNVETYFDRGLLAIVDPMVVHWLTPSGQVKSGEIWYGLQWEIPRKNAYRRISSIVEEIKGDWLPITDRRYVKYGKKEKILEKN